MNHNGLKLKTLKHVVGLALYTLLALISGLAVITSDEHAGNAVVELYRTLNLPFWLELFVFAAASGMAVVSGLLAINMYKLFRIEKQLASVEK